MVPVDLVAITATLGALLLFFRRDIPGAYDVRQLRQPNEAIRDAATFPAGWIVLALLLAGFFMLEPLGVPVSAVAAAGAALLLVIAGRGHIIQTRKVLRGAPWQVVIFSLGMYLVVYGLRNAGLTDHLAALLDRTAEGGVWGARSEEHTSELQSLMRISYAVFCLKKKNKTHQETIQHMERMFNTTRK